MTSRRPISPVVWMTLVALALFAVPAYAAAPGLPALTVTTPPAAARPTR